MRNLQLKYYLRIQWFSDFSQDADDDVIEALKEVL